ncbi:MAG: hypothetical protein ACI7YS_14145 [Flavobacterium sp.]
MKRFLGLFIVLFLISACDDGDMTVDNIDFADVSAQKCSNKDIIYKIKGNEMLLLVLPEYIFVADETPDGQPVELPINSTNQVIYRTYNGTVSSNNICPDVPSATPNVTEEWNALSGIIQITSTAIKSTNSTTHATKITGYKYYIEFKNITFQKPEGAQVYETFVFGNYNTSITPLAFGFDEEVEKSSCDDRVFNFSGSEAFLLDVEDFNGLFKNEVTTAPRTLLIDNFNTVTYKLFTGNVEDAYFCTSPAPILPVLTQEWNAENGIEATNGIIEVTTTTLGNGFQHTIRFKKVTLKKGNSDFFLGNDYLFGSFITYP